MTHPKKLKSPMKQNEFYCVSCRKKVRAHDDDIKIRKDKRGRPRMVASTSSTSKCNHKLYKYISFDKETKLKNKYNKSK